MCIAGRNTSQWHKGNLGDTIPPSHTLVWGSLTVGLTHTFGGFPESGLPSVTSLFPDSLKIGVHPGVVPHCNMFPLIPQQSFEHLIFGMGPRHNRHKSGNKDGCNVVTTQCQVMYIRGKLFLAPRQVTPTKVPPPHILQEPPNVRLLKYSSRNINWNSLPAH